MVQTAMFASTAIGVNLNTDIKKGVFDRFRSLPISRAAPLVGAVLGEVVRFSVSITVVMITGYLMGFRVHTDPLRALAACLLVLAFSLSVSWSAVLLGLVVREPGVVQGIGFLLLFPLTFGSSTYVPVQTLPDWLQSWVHINPVTHLIDASRALMLGGPAASAVWQSLLWCVIFVGVFAPLAVRAYRRRT
jgi:oleandomycin transport system permease protein